MNKASSRSVVIVNQTELAAGLRVSPRAVMQWEREGLRDAARLEDKGRSVRYDLFAAVRWWHERELAKVEPDSRGDEMDAARLRKLEADAAMKELDLSVKRNELVPIDEVEVLLREALESVDSVLRHSSSRVAPRLSKDAGIPIKGARTIMEDVIESVRGLIRAGDDDG